MTTDFDAGLLLRSATLRTGTSPWAWRARVAHHRAGSCDGPVATPPRVVVEARDDARDERADAVVILDEPLPLDRTPTPERRAREAGNNRRLTQKVRRRRLKRPARGVHHAHRVLDAHELLARLLRVALRAPEARQY